MSGGNSKFSEYATSGAFSVALSRNQVSTLSMVAAGGLKWAGHMCAALERRGLVTAVLMEPDQASVTEAHPVEYRATYAGLLCVALVREAGLVNGEADAVASEIGQLHADLSASREALAEALRLARSFQVRMQEAEAERADAQAIIAQLKEEARVGHRLRPGEDGYHKLRVDVRLRDPFPGVTDEQLAARVDAIWGERP